MVYRVILIINFVVKSAHHLPDRLLNSLPDDKKFTYF